MAAKNILFAKYMKYICTCQKKVVPLRDYLRVHVKNAYAHVY